MSTLEGVAHRHLQTAYAGLQKSLHKEWSFVQCVTIDMGMAFQVVEDALWDIFVLALFQGGTFQIPGRAIIGLQVKQAEIALPDPTWNVG